MTKKEIAKQLNISRDTLNKWLVQLDLDRKPDLGKVDMLRIQTARNKTKYKKKLDKLVAENYFLEKSEYITSIEDIDTQKNNLVTRYNQNEKIINELSAEYELHKDDFGTYFYDTCNGAKAEHPAGKIMREFQASNRSILRLMTSLCGEITSSKNDNLSPLDKLRLKQEKLDKKVPK